MNSPFIQRKMGLDKLAVLRRQKTQAGGTGHAEITGSCPENFQIYHIIIAE